MSSFGKFSPKKKIFGIHFGGLTCLLLKLLIVQWKLVSRFIQLDMPFTRIEQVVMASIYCAQAISSSLFLVINRRLGLTILILSSIYVKSRTHTLVWYQKHIAIL